MTSEEIEVGKEYYVLSGYDEYDQIYADVIHIYLSEHFDSDGRTNYLGFRRTSDGHELYFFPETTVAKSVETYFSEIIDQVYLEDRWERFNVTR